MCPARVPSHPLQITSIPASHDTTGISGDLKLNLIFFWQVLESAVKKSLIYQTQTSWFSRSSSWAHPCICVQLLSSALYLSAALELTPVSECSFWPKHHTLAPPLSTELGQSLEVPGSPLPSIPASPSPHVSPWPAWIWFFTTRTYGRL